jgi:hypothetical protein
MSPESRTLQLEQRQHFGRTPVQNLGSFLHATGLHTSNRDEESLPLLHGLDLLAGEARWIMAFPPGTSMRTIERFLWTA